MHADRFGCHGALVIDLELPDDFAWETGYRAWQVDSIEKLACLAQRDPAMAFDCIAASAESLALIEPPLWLERFVRGLIGNSLPITLIARRCGVTPEHASRMCRRWFSANPTIIRREFRARKALELLKAGCRPAQVATEAGFADQPHMTRTLKSMTGATPAHIQSNWKTGR